MSYSQKLMQPRTRSISAVPEPFATLHRACTLWVLVDCRKEQDVLLALMIPFVMIMLHILGQCMAERRFPEQDESRQALLLDERTHRSA